MRIITKSLITNVHHQRGMLLDPPYLEYGVVTERAISSETVSYHFSILA